jgi:hypothetical protein
VESTHNNITLYANAVPDGKPVATQVVVAYVVNVVHPGGGPEPPTVVLMSQLLNTHPVPNALAFQVRVRLLCVDPGVCTKEDIIGVALSVAVDAAVLVALMGLLTATSEQTAPTL